MYRSDVEPIGTGRLSQALKRLLLDHSSCPNAMPPFQSRPSQQNAAVSSQNSRPCAAGQREPLPGYVPGKGPTEGTESPVGEYQASPFSPDVHNSHIAKLVEQCQPRKRPGTRKEESLEPVHRKFSLVTWPTPLVEAAAAIWLPVAAAVAAASLRATAGAICCHPSLPSPKAWQGDSGAGGCATEGTGRELEKPWKRKLASC